MASRIALASAPIARGVFVVGRQAATLGRGFSISTTSKVGLKESSGRECHFFSYFLSLSSSSVL